MTYQFASAIVSTKSFNTVAEYVAAVQHNAPSLAWDTVKDWRSICKLLNIDFETVAKGKARPAIDKVASELHGKTTVKTSVAVKVPTTTPATTHKTDVLSTPTVSVPAALPAVKEDVAPVAVLPKAPKRADYPKTEEGEDQFDAAMTEWILLKKQIQAGEMPAAKETAEVVEEVQTVAVEVVEEVSAEVIETPAAVAPEQKAKFVKPSLKEQKKAEAAPVVVEQDETDGDNVEETAMQLARLLKGLKPKGQPAEVKPEQILTVVTEKLAEFEKAIDTKYGELMQAELKSLLQIANETIAEEVAKAKAELTAPTQIIAVSVNGAEPKKIKGLVHERYSDILKHVAVRDNVMLVGPAGSGKTTVCENVADALSLDFYCQSVCAQTSKAELLGYMDANGNFVSTQFRVAYENGGVFVLDEIDAGNPNVIAVLNSALANSYCAFADGMIRKHEDFVLIACANTFGTGASREYVGRNQLDSATLDRFSVIEFGYDEKLERSLASDKTFCKFVQKVRKELAGERVVISPRASIQGGKLIAAGCTPEYVMQTRITKGMSANLIERVKTVYNTIYKPETTEEQTVQVDAVVGEVE